MKNIYKSAFALFLIFCFSGFSGLYWSDKSIEKQKEERLKVAHQTLNDLYKYQPNAKRAIEKAYGYAVFNSSGVHLLLLSNEHGIGVAHDNKTGKNIYMNMLSLGGGFGLGIKEFRAVFIFENKDVYDHFVTYGWEANAQVDAAAQIKDYNDASLNGSISVAPGVYLYKMTDTGLALQATIQGTKYWQDGDLNK